MLLREFKRNYIDRTSYGSIRSYNLFYKKDLEFIIKNTLINSGIMWFNEIIPAPYLENEFLERLERNEWIIINGLSLKILLRNLGVKKRKYAH